MAKKTNKKRRVKLGVTLPETLIKKVENIEEVNLINKSKLVENLLKKYINENTK
jgi:metal-responsive CopG/Arc/MetJ family transcriptional regulator